MTPSAASASLVLPPVAPSPQGGPATSPGVAGASGQGRENGFARELNRARELGSSSGPDRESSARAGAEGAESGTTEDSLAAKGRGDDPRAAQRRADDGEAARAASARGRPGPQAAAKAANAAADPARVAMARVGAKDATADLADLAGAAAETDAALAVAPIATKDADHDNADKEVASVADPLLAALFGEHPIATGDEVESAPARAGQLTVGARIEDVTGEDALVAAAARDEGVARPERRLPAPAEQAFDRAAARAAFLRADPAQDAATGRSDGALLRRDGMGMGTFEAAREGVLSTMGSAGVQAAPVGSAGSSSLALQGALLPAGASAGAAPAVVEARLAAAPGQAAFAPELGAQLTVFVRDGVQVARLQLHPAELGPVLVQIQLEGQAAQVHLAAENPFTREKLDEAMPVLAGSLREAGLTLTGGGVFEHSRRDGGATGDGASAPPAGSDDAARSGLAEAGPASAPVPRRRGVVDLVA